MAPKDLMTYGFKVYKMCDYPKINIAAIYQSIFKECQHYRVKHVTVEIYGHEIPTRITELI